MYQNGLVTARRQPPRGIKWCHGRYPEARPLSTVVEGQQWRRSARQAGSFKNGLGHKWVRPEDETEETIRSVRSEMFCRPGVSARGQPPRPCAAQEQRET